MTIFAIILLVLSAIRQLLCLANREVSLYDFVIRVYEYLWKREPPYLKADSHSVYVLPNRQFQN